MESTIQKINKESYFFIFYLFIRWLFSMSYYKAIPVKSIKYNSEIYDNTKKILITSTGIDLIKFHIPYENILIFGKENNNIVMNIFAKINESNLEPSSNICKITINFEKLNDSIMGDIKKNMYYHIKYNKINQNVIDYYKDKHD
jgi:hypothetical protein